MRPVARGHTKAFVQFNEDNKLEALRSLAEKTGNRFTGRLEGVFRLDSGEINVVIEVKDGAIVAMGITGVEDHKGAMALRRFTEIFPKITGFFEVIELDPSGVDLDLEYNPEYKLSVPSSFNLFIERLRLRTERELSSKERTRPFQITSRETRPAQRQVAKRVEEQKTTTLKPKAIELAKRETIQQKTKPTPAEVKPKPPTRIWEKPREKPKPVAKEEAREVEKREKKLAPVKPVEVEKEVKEAREVVEAPKRVEKAVEETKVERKLVREEKPLVEEVGKKVEEAEEPKPKPTREVVVEAIPRETVLPKVEAPATTRPIPADMLLEEVEEKPEKTITPRREEEIKRSPEEIVNGLPFDDEIDKISKILSMDRERLMLALSSSVHILKHDKGTILDALRDTVDSSTTSDLPVQLIIRKGDKSYSVLAYKGLIKAAFKIDEKDMDVELVGKETLYDLVKTLYKGEHEYTLVNIQENYLLAGMGLKTIEEEEEIEEQAEGLLGKLRKLFGGR